MHYSLLITFNKEKAENSKEARQYVNNELINDTSFVGEGGRFSSPVADWFVVGGRWSGTLNDLHNEFIKKVREKYPPEHEFGYSTKFVDGNQENFQKLWEDMGGKDKNPYNRDTYQDLGYEDDAILVDEKTYNEKLKEFEGTEFGYTESSYEGHSWKDLHFVDLDYERVSKDFIGRKWVVIVDYHS